LFGHLDRQIKRLMDAGEAVFDDVLSDDLMKRLLFQATHVNPESDKIREVRETYDIKQMSAGDGQDDSNDDLIACNDEMIEAVAATLRVDIGQIKDTLDQYKQMEGGDSRLLESTADGLHAVANTLGMIGLDGHASPLAGWEQSLRAAIEGKASLGESDYVDLANTLVVVEDAMGSRLTRLRMLSAVSNSLLKKSPRIAVTPVRPWMLQKKACTSLVTPVPMRKLRQLDRPMLFLDRLVRVLTM